MKTLHAIECFGRRGRGKQGVRAAWVRPYGYDLIDSTARAYQSRDWSARGTICALRRAQPSTSSAAVA
jgi:hypothetical protein